MMTAYNNVRYLKAAIDSVKAQVYENWELIVQDDCSTDGTYELAWAMAQQEPRIKVFKNAKNLGTAGARAQAVLNCTGDYIGHIDSDDMLFPFTLSVVTKYFEKHPDVALVYSDMADMDVEGNIFGYRASKNYGENLGNYGWTHFGAYRRTAYEQIKGYNPDIPCCEDGDLFMQIADKLKFGRIPMVLYMYRNHTTNTSAKNNKCESCPARTTTCNFSRIWAKHVGYDLETWKPLEKKEEQGKQGETNG
jgi:glycosyltransferase involved in cell wall biosynthesis